MGKHIIFVTWRLLITALLTVDQIVQSSPTHNFQRVTELDMNSHSNVAGSNLFAGGPSAPVLLIGRKTIADFESFPGSPELLVSDEAPNPTGDIDPGSSTVASDIYGLGVRLGFYFQAFGMILTLPRRYGGGALKLASGSVSISILVCWSIFTAEKLFSPCEAFLTLLMTTTVVFPATRTVFSRSGHEVGEGLGLFLNTVTDAWVTVAMILTLAIEVHRLPLLGTENKVFFFAKVTLTGPYRWISLLVYIVNVPFFISKFFITMKRVWVLMELYFDGSKESEAEGEVELPVPTLIFVIELIISAKIWTSVGLFLDGAGIPNVEEEMEMHFGSAEVSKGEGETGMHLDGAEMPKGEGGGEMKASRLGFFSRIVPTDMVENQKKRKRYLCTSSVVTVIGVVYLILSVEMTIKWNHLKPLNNIRTPGQLIPLIGGFLALVDGLLFLFHPKPRETNDVPNGNL